jgi:hypothetical protein
MTDLWLPKEWIRLTRSHILCEYSGWGFRGPMISRPPWLVRHDSASVIGTDKCYIFGSYANGVPLPSGSVGLWEPKPSPPLRASINNRIGLLQDQGDLVGCERRVPGRRRTLPFTVHGCPAAYPAAGGTMVF